MSRVYYNKLVRDGIPKKIEAEGSEYETRSIHDTVEFQQELLKKVVEEAGELSRARVREEFLDEYTDLMVVLDTLITLQNITEIEIMAARQENTKRKGAFDAQLFLHWSSDSEYKSNETPQGIRT